MADEPQEHAAIVPVRQQTVACYEDQGRAAQDADATSWVPLRPLCAALGLDWSAQTRPAAAGSYPGGGPARRRHNGN